MLIFTTFFYIFTTSGPDELVEGKIYGFEVSGYEGFPIVNYDKFVRGVNFELSRLEEEKPRIRYKRERFICWV